MVFFARGEILGLRSLSRSGIAILLALAILASLVPVMAARGTLSITSFTKVLGIPLTNEESTTITTVPPNVKVLKILQAGRQAIKIFRVRVLSIDAVLDEDGLIKGFYVGLEVRSPDPTSVKVILALNIINGEIISVEKPFVLDKGKTIVYIELPNPVDPDDIVGIDINAIPS